jgi:hypothetical protein
MFPDVLFSISWDCFFFCARGAVLPYFFEFAQFGEIKIGSQWVFARFGEWGLHSLMRLDLN